MNNKRRSSERVKAIDRFIAIHYPSKGADFCSTSLKEPFDYILARVNLKQIKRIKREKVTESPLQKHKRLNKELRRENIKLITENRNLRMIMAGKIMCETIELAQKLTVLNIKPEEIQIGGIVPEVTLPGEIVQVNSIEGSERLKDAFFRSGITVLKPDFDVDDLLKKMDSYTKQGDENGK